VTKALGYKDARVGSDEYTLEHLGVAKMDGKKNIFLQDYILT
jgi:hypothetical protein